jgi:hypothetical protein
VTAAGAAGENQSQCCGARVGQPDVDELLALSFIPPEQIVQGPTAGNPTPDAACVTPDERAMTARRLAKIHLVKYSIN